MLQRYSFLSQFCIFPALLIFLDSRAEFRTTFENTTPYPVALNPIFSVPEDRWQNALTMEPSSKVVYHTDIYHTEKGSILSPEEIDELYWTAARMLIGGTEVTCDMRMHINPHGNALRFLVSSQSAQSCTLEIFVD